jgi:hypothetical protein
MPDHAKLTGAVNFFAIDLDDGKSFNVIEDRDNKAKTTDLRIIPLDDLSATYTETDKAKIKEIIRVT